jgi:GH18 family chitinase
VTSGAAAKLTHVDYAFANVSEDGHCFEANRVGEGDAWADYQRPASADESVHGVADSPDQALKGNFNQLRKLRARTRTSRCCCRSAAGSRAGRPGPSWCSACPSTAAAAPA